MCLLSTPCGIVAATDMGIASAKSARCGDCIGVGYSAMSPDFSFSTGLRATKRDPADLEPEDLAGRDPSHVG